MSADLSVLEELEAGISQRPAGESEIGSRQKAAALVIALGSRTSAQLMRHLSEDEVELLASEVAKLETIDPDTLELVLREVQEEIIGHKLVTQGGMQYAKELVMAWRGSKGAEIIERIMATRTSMPFGFLRDVDPEQLVQFLKEEHPQTVALILTHQPASYASRVLAGLESDMQREVTLRIAAMGRTSPDVIRNVESVLQARLGAMTSAEATQRGGVKDLAEMLNHADRTTEKAILERIAEVDPELAEQVRALMFVFEDIALLDDRSIQEVIQTIDQQTLATAMKGVRPDVQDAIFRNMSSRARENLAEEMEIMGQVRRTEMEEAQSEVVARIRHLDETGQIVISRKGGGDLVG
ncbi:MAG: flagellar motor switch protein FliG [Acidimicrobiia bacterium]